MSRQSWIDSMLDGFAERQRARDQMRREKQVAARAAREIPLPLHAPVLISKGREAKPTFETPRTHETHTEIPVARRRR
jgi:hypothetical protein